LPFGRARFPVVFGLLAIVDCCDAGLVEEDEDGKDGSCVESEVNLEAAAEVEGTVGEVVGGGEEADGVNDLANTFLLLVCSDQANGDDGLGVIGLRTTLLPFPAVALKLDPLGGRSNPVACSVSSVIEIRGLSAGTIRSSSCLLAVYCDAMRKWRGVD